MRFDLRSLWLACALGMAASNAYAGTICGTVKAEGKTGTEAGSAGGRYESRRLKFAQRVDYAAMKDFVVSVEGPMANLPAPEPREVVIQKDAMFDPHVMAVQVGTTIEWPNSDDIFHNVFSMSDAKPFDLGLYKEGVKKVTFDKPGRVDVFCSIHADMHCIILVLENPFFTLTDAKGRYEIPNLPAGAYKLKAWQERLPPQVKEITVPEQGEVKTDFVLGITGLPQY